MVLMQILDIFIRSARIFYPDEYIDEIKKGLLSFIVISLNINIYML